MMGFVSDIASNDAIRSWHTMHRGYQTVHIEVLNEKDKLRLYSELDKFKSLLDERDILAKNKKHTTDFYTIDFKNSSCCSLQVLNKVLEICQEIFPKEFEHDDLKNIWNRK